MPEIAGKRISLLGSRILTSGPPLALYTMKSKEKEIEEYGFTDLRVAALRDDEG